MAGTHVITESKINAFTAQLTQGSLTYESFIENGLHPQKAPNASAIPTAVAAALDADEHDIMISIHRLLRWLHMSQTPTPTPWTY